MGEDPFPYIDLFPELQNIIRHSLGWHAVIMMAATCKAERAACLPLCVPWPEKIREAYERLGCLDLDKDLRTTLMEVSLCLMDWFKFCPPTFCDPCCYTTGTWYGKIIWRNFSRTGLLTHYIKLSYGRWEGGTLAIGLTTSQSDGWSHNLRIPLTLRDAWRDILTTISNTLS